MIYCEVKVPRNAQDFETYRATPPKSNHAQFTCEEFFYHDSNSTLAKVAVGITKIRINIKFLKKTPEHKQTIIGLIGATVGVITIHSLGTCHLC
jgi:hypothetical protein